MRGGASAEVLRSSYRQIFTPPYQPARQALENSPIKRLVIEDASAQVMPKSNAEEFPAHGNHHGSTAGVKIDFTYDLIAGEVIAHSLEQATRQDKLIGKETLAEVKAEDLVVRDMGYFIIDEFSVIEDLDACLLTRLPLTTDAALESGKALEKLLKITKKDVLNLQVTIGEQRKKCRLVAIRAENTVARKRRAERRKQARAKGKQPGQKALIRDGWHIMLTNLEVSGQRSTYAIGARVLASIVAMRLRSYLRAPQPGVA